ncbi:MAG: YbhN family protein [bacterium]
MLLLRVALASAALWALWQRLDGVTLAGLAVQLRSLGWPRLAVALAATIVSFLLMGLIEVLALRHCDDPAAADVPASTAMTTAFVANAMSQSIGLSLLTGAAVRARAYGARGLDSLAIAQATAFVTITATLGLLAAGAVAMLASTSAIARGGIPMAVRPTAFLLIALVSAYVAWSFLGHRDGIGRGRWRIARPSPRLAVTQLALSTVDWLVTGAVLYACLPPDLGYPLGVALGTYMIAQTAGVTSHVPAGAGIFELVVIALLAHGAPPASRAGVVAALVTFRLMYYVLPLVAALVVAALAEISRRRARITGRALPASPVSTRGIAAVQHAG